MAFIPATNTSFIGDSFLLKYLNIYLKLPITQTNISATLGNGTSLIHCDFVMPDQRLYQAISSVPMLLRAGCQLHEKVVVFIGAYDVLDFIRDTNRLIHHMATDLHRLLQYLSQQNVKEIILCTIPLVLELPRQGTRIVQFYNNYIKALDGVQIQGAAIKVVDISSVLHFDELLESNQSSPNVEGYRKMHEALREFL